MGRTRSRPLGNRRGPGRPDPAPPGAPRPRVASPVSGQPVLGVLPATDLAALADLIHEVMAFLPLGALLAILHPRWSVRRLAAIGLGLGLTLEVGQLVRADRTADRTDALEAAAGATIGVMLCRW
jgi:hypothetical protein